MIGRECRCFSPDGRMLLAVDPDKSLRLIQTETGKTIARLTSPDQYDVWGATFSPDGSRLVINNRAARAVQEWNLRAIRKHLGGMGLDWNSPAYSGDDPADSSAPPLPTLQVDYGSLADELEFINEPPEALLERHAAQTKDAIPMTPMPTTSALMRSRNWGGIPKRSRPAPTRFACAHATLTSGPFGESSSWNWDKNSRRSMTGRPRSSSNRSNDCSQNGCPSVAPPRAWELATVPERAARSRPGAGNGSTRGRLESRGTPCA